MSEDRDSGAEARATAGTDKVVMAELLSELPAFRVFLEDKGRAMEAHQPRRALSQDLGQLTAMEPGQVARVEKKQERD